MLMCCQQILKDATTVFSRVSPDLPTVIPTMDRIDTYFTWAISPSGRKNPAIRAALKVAKCTLNRYYSLTDASETYRIAMGASSCSLVFICSLIYLTVLHPQHKLDYFKKADWETSWIETAEQLMRERFDSDYDKTMEQVDIDYSSDGEVSMQLVCKLIIFVFVHCTNSNLGRHIVG